MGLLDALPKNAGGLYARRIALGHVDDAEAAVASVEPHELANDALRAEYTRTRARGVDRPRRARAPRLAASVSGALALHLVRLLAERRARLLRQMLQRLLPLRTGGRFLDVRASCPLLLLGRHDEARVCNGQTNSRKSRSG